ncbi:MAG: YgiQ family radical SAM protein [Candidatus Omnitrophota bacterium]|nr:YgiQ family radical SAM protein [Candidatus Omnitrophota bacterium]
MSRRFLPISKEDLDERGWDTLDIVLITGDAYVDHPSYGAALIGRALEDAGFKVGIIAQPDWKKPDDFVKLGRPRLFFGVSAGNLDSMVANYTANRKLRRTDDYSAGGKPFKRPDRASILYANKIREVFPGAMVVLGGVEASLRRLAHYDYWSDTVKRSILLDSKADILVYGMGERQVLEISRRLARGENKHDLNNINGTVIARSSIDGINDYVEIPSFEEVASHKDKFIHAFKKIYSETDPHRGKCVIQKHGGRFVIQLPGALPLTSAELDKLYLLDYARSWHRAYDKDGGVPGFETVRFSITSHRGCPGSCNFCSLYLHQGRIVQSRSPGSILKEAEILTRLKGFGGTITDVGGPTANLYKCECKFWKNEGACRDKLCLIPSKCENLTLGYSQTIKLWDECAKIPKVKHIFIGSGLRHDLLTDRLSGEYLRRLCASHISGRIKVAPEYCGDAILKLMNKPTFGVYEQFVSRFNETNRQLHKKQFLVNYFINAHPGTSLLDALGLALILMSKGLRPEQIQDFIPLPMTASGCMYYTEKDISTGNPIYVAKGERARRLQRALIQYNQPQNKKYILEALKLLNRPDLKNKFMRAITPKK